MKLWFGMAALFLPLAGCDSDSGTRQILQAKAERAKSDTHALWSIRVVGEANNGRPVLICANRRMIEGFGSILPVSADKPCLREQQMKADGVGVHFTCRLNGVTYGVTSGTEGDPARDFQVVSMVHPLTADGPDYQRTLRFQRLGDCPASWQVGDATDQTGARTVAYREEDN